MNRPRPVNLAPAPAFSFSTDGPSLATIYSSHYDRMIAVIEAARTGNDRLIRLALEDCDRHGSGDEDRAD